MLNKICKLLTVLLIMQGCSVPAKENVPLKILKMKLKNKHYIPVKNNLMDISISFQPLFSNSIYFIDPNSKTLSKLIVHKSKFIVICNLEEFDIDSERFSINEEKKEVYLFNSEHVKVYSFHGELKWTYQFQYYDHGFVVLINNNNIPIIRNGKIFAHYTKDNDKSYKDSMFFKTPIQVEINNRNKSVEFSKVSYPLSYSENCFGMNYAPDRVGFNNDLQLFTFAYSDTAYIYNEKSGEIKSYYLGTHSKHDFEYIPFYEIKNLNETVFFEHFFRSPKYIFTKVAPLSGYILRRLAVLDKKNEKLKETLIVYDKHFNYIGESVSGFKSYVNVDTKNGLFSVKLNLQKQCLETYQLSW